MNPTPDTMDVLRKFPNPVRISHKTSPPITITKDQVEAADTVNVWHKFILFDVNKEDKKMILKSLIEACSPNLMLPLAFKMEGSHKATFLASCQQDLIKKLMTKNLKISLPNGKTVKVDVVLSFLDFKEMPINPINVIGGFLKDRIHKDLQKKCLNLADFDSIKNLGSIYCPLAVPIVLETILHISKMVLNPRLQEGYKLQIRELILRKNNIKNIILGEKHFSYSLCKLDLSHNRIEELTSLKIFSEFQITELWLDNNPVCDKFDNPKDYVTAVRKFFPYVQILDGIVLGNLGKLLPRHGQQFLCDKSKTELVKQFVQHFFKLYDQEDRMAMNGLYDSNAIFSMTLGDITNPLHKQILKTFAMNRNLLKCIDYAKVTELLLRGSDKIMAILRHQPPTIHKLKFVDMDLMYSDEKSFCVALQGPFMLKKCSIQPLWFHRTLLVVAKGDDEFAIVNDQFHIDNLSVNFNINDIEELRNTVERPIPPLDPITLSKAEKKQVLKLFQEVTTMNFDHCMQYLLPANYDLRAAINRFMDDYVKEKVPGNAFWK